MLKNFFGLFREAGKSFSLHHNGERAAALSYYTLLTLVPVIMVMSSMVAFFLRTSDGASLKLVQEIMQVIPVGKELFLQNIESLMKHRSSLGIVGIAVLFMMVHNLLRNLERAMSRIFGEVSRTAVKAHLFGMLFILALALLLVVPHFLDFIGIFLARFDVNFPSHLLGHK